MLIQVVSDLHLEFAPLTLFNHRNADVLILSGDIKSAKMDATDFFDHVSKEYPKVFYVAGNHEFYGGDFATEIERIRDFCSRYSNVTFLDDEHVVHNGVLFIGSTLWTSMKHTPDFEHSFFQQAMNDYRAISNGHGQKLAPADTILAHHTSMAYIEKTIHDFEFSDPDMPIVVMTHHMPSYLSVHPKYRGSSLNECFYSELGDFIADKKNLTLWTCGHTHDPHKYRIGNTVILANPRGYVFSRRNEAENPNWNPDYGLIDISVPVEELVPDENVVQWLLE